MPSVAGVWRSHLVALAVGDVCLCVLARCPAGADRLTQREAELCSSARLLPTHYLSLKDVMMRDAQVHGHISRFDVSAAARAGGRVALWRVGEV